MGYFMPIEFIYSKGDGKMKRWMAFLLAALLLLAAASAAASDVNEASKFTGGASWDTAAAITEDQCGVLYYSALAKGNIYDIMDDWYVLQAETDGTYYINITNSNDSSAIELFDSNMNQIEKANIERNNQLIIALSVRAYEKIYLNHNRIGQLKDYNKYYFSVCFDGHHLPGLVSEITAAPTCTEPGTRTFPCDLCGEPAATEEIPALGHTPGEWKQIKEAACTEPGLLAQVCSVCGETLASEEVPALGHDASEMSVVTDSGRAENQPVQALLHRFAKRDDSYRRAHPRRNEGTLRADLHRKRLRRAALHRLQRAPRR